MITDAQFRELGEGGDERAPVLFDETGVRVQHRTRAKVNFYFGKNMMMKFVSKLTLLLMTATLAPITVLSATPANPLAERIASDRMKISWTDTGSVNVYVADEPDASISTSQLVSANDRDGVHELAVPVGKRPYFLLRDNRDHKTVRVAERVLPLERGSNFRDIGGYPAAGGRHVKWGMIYRSGATPLLTDADVKKVEALNLTNMVDLRSIEERQLAPSRIVGIPYNAVGYSMAPLMSAAESTSHPSEAAVPIDLGAFYRKMPETMAPQFRLLFDRLLANGAPLVYNCSAGQDRTGLATALILAALGVPRDIIIADYHLSTQYRRPEYEMPSFDPAAFQNNAAAQMFAQYKGTKAEPLKDANGEAFLSSAFEVIDKRYGSVEAYLDRVLDVSAIDLAALRRIYTE